MKRMKLIMIAVMSVILVTPVFAGKGSEGSSVEKSEPKMKAQTLCPVMGGKINPDLYVDVNGKRIYVCCRGCVAEVKKHPAKYIKKLEDQGVTLPDLQTTCPVTGDKINPDLYVDVKGKRIYTCCKDCISTIKKNPEKYIKKLEDQHVIIADTPDKKHDGK